MSSAAAIAETAFAERTERQAAGAEGSRLVVALFLLYAFSTIIDGVLRYVLVNASVPVELLYARDLVLALAVVATLLSRIRQREGFIILVLGLAAAVHGVIGWSSTHSAAQVLFGFKVLVIVAFGAIAARYLDPASPTVRRWFLVLWLTAVAGVLLNAVIDLPWTGLVYTVGDIDVEASRDWSNGGVGRAAGFSRFSFSAAIQVATLSLLLITTTRSRVRQAAVFGFGLMAVYLTDAKGSILAFTIATFVYWCLGHRQLLLLKVSACLAVLVTVLLPVVLPGLHLQGAFGNSNALRSFLERLMLGWPDAWTLIFHDGSGLLGRGIGGIGSAQRLFAPSFYNPCDNLFIFLFGYFGLFAVAYVAVPIICLLRLPSQVPGGIRFAGVLLLYFLIYGAVVSILEDQFAGIFLGLVIGTLASGHARSGAANPTPDLATSASIAGR